MGGYYKVQLEAMDRLTRDLSDCADDMRAAMRLLKDIGPKGSGHEGLENACDDFQDSWSYGIGQIADATSGITEGLTATRKVYQGLEEHIAGDFTAMAKGGAA
jgi:hypothetical protein